MMHFTFPAASTAVCLKQMRMEESGQQIKEAYLQFQYIIGKSRMKIQMSAILLVF